MARGRTLVRPEWTTLPPSNITAGEWGVARDEISAVATVADQLTTRVSDVRSFGTIGTSDDSGTFIAAMSELASRGGGVLTGPLGFYQFQQKIAHPANVTVDFPLGTVFDFTATPTGSENSASMWYGAGELTALPALSANIPLHGRTIAFASAHGLAPGDRVVLYDSADFSFSAERAYYRAGEFVQVTEVPSSTTITIASPTYAAYASGSTVTAHRMAPASFALSGIHFEIPTGTTGVTFDLATRVTTNNVSGNGGEHSLFALRRCVDISLNGLYGWMVLPAPTGTNYALSIQNSQDIIINDPTLRSTRHGLTVTGSSYVGAVPNRNIQVNGGTIGNTGDSIAGCDFHGNTEYAYFDGVFMPNGLHMAGDHLYVSETCRILSSGGGTAVELSNFIGWDIEINATVQATRELSTNGLVYINGRAETVRSGWMRIGGRVELGDYRASDGSARGVYINSTGPAQGNVEVTAHVSATNTTPGQNIVGLWVRATTGASFGVVKMDSAEFWQCGAVVESTSMVFARDVISRTAPRHGIAITATNIHSQNNHVRNAGEAGLRYTGAGIGVGEIHSLNDTSLDNNASATATSSNASILILNTGECVYRGATIGDTRSTPLQLRADQINNVTRLHTELAVILGTVTTQNRSGIGTTVNV